jgi:hypothetical protein
MLAFISGSARNEPSKRPDQRDSTEQRDFPLEVGPDAIALRVQQGQGPAGTSVPVRNSQAVPLTLERIETSCPCIGVSGLPVRLEPDETVDLKLAFDPSHEPEFAGALLVRVTGYLAENRVAFETKVRLQVDPEGADRAD